MGSTQQRSDITDVYGAFTFKDDLIYFALENHDNWRHREAAIEKDPFIRAFIKRLDEEIFQKTPFFKPDILSKSSSKINTENFDESSPSFSIIEEWENERWSQLFTKLFDKARTHSYAVVKLYNEPPYWRIYCDREITEIKYNDNGQPIGCSVEFAISLPKSDKYLNIKEDLTFVKREQIFEIGEQNFAIFIPFGIPESDERLGEFALEDKWSTAIRLRYCSLDISDNSAKTSGFYHFLYGDSIDSTKKTSLTNAIDLVGSSRGIGAKEDVLKKIDAIFPGKPEFTIEAIKEFKEQFAMACRLPLVYFKSESSGGQMFSSGKYNYAESEKINETKRTVFATFKPYIIDLIFMRWGIVIEDVEPDLDEPEMEELEVNTGQNQPVDNNTKEIDENKIEMIRE